LLVLLAEGALYQLPPYEVVHDRLEPMLTLLVRELRSAPKKSDLEPQKTMLLRALPASVALRAESPSDITSEILEPRDAEQPLDAVLTAVQRGTECGIVVLFAPERGLTRFRSSGRFSTTDSALIKSIVSAHLTAAVRNRTVPVTINKMRDQKSGKMVPYRFICAALRQGPRQIGTVVCVRRQEDPAFEGDHAAALEALVTSITQLVVSHTDDTTGLLTRAAFELEAQRLLAVNERAPYSIVHLDVDRLHVVNDLFGFEAGNAVLRNIGIAIRRQPMLFGGVACRLGGDQFAIMLANTRSNVAQQWTQTLRSTLQTMAMPPACAGLEVTTSVGVAEAEPGTRIEQTLGAAESATKAAKDRGRDRVELFACDDASLMQRHEDVAIFRNLVGALKAGEFQLYAQPIVSLVEPDPAPRFEILLRMLGHDGRVLPPRKFMSAATRYQLLPQLDRWVLSETLATLQPHVESLTTLKASFSVNLSGPTLAEPQFADVVRKAFRSYAVPTSLVSFEITESAAMRSLEAASEFINEMREIGCRFSLDDFGTGVSSLAYLKSLKVSILKIDGSFVRDLTTNTQSQSMVRAILEIARDLQLETVAEFVESVELAARVAAMGVTYAQGYAFGKPRPLNDVLDDLLQRKSDLQDFWYAGQPAEGQDDAPAATLPIVRSA
jgi:diguanylate cyclase (GGDEF)-like protein